MILMPDAAQLDMIGNSIVSAGDGSILGSKLHLFQTRNQVANPVIGDFVLADYTGHTEPVPTWTPRVTDDGETGLSTQETFTPTGTTLANQINGWVLTDSTSAVVIAYEDYDAPRNMSSPDDVIYQTINLVVPSGSAWGYGVAS